MIKVEIGREKEQFVAYIENVLSNLANKQYKSFLEQFDSSRLSEAELVLALKFLDTTCPVIKIDNPLECDCKDRRISVFQYSNGRGYSVDYDLSTNGEMNDLTLQVEFIKTDSGYSVSLDDLHTL